MGRPRINRRKRLFWLLLTGLVLIWFIRGRVQTRAELDDAPAPVA